MALQIRKASRERVFLKLGIAGPSGSGKTKGALALATQLVPDGRVLVLDTENGSASLYADQFAFDVIDLAPPYESRFYVEAIDLAVREGYDVLVVDSLSHQWEGTGGILDRKMEEERNGKNVNGFALWGKYKEEHRRFMARLLQAPIHIIACMRSKQEFVQTEDRKIKKLGMAPITGENAEYEFSIVFDVGMNHKAEASKDRSELFDGKFVDLIADRPGEKIAAWMNAGAQPAPRPLPAPAPAAAPAAPRDPKARKFPKTKAWPHLEGQALGFVATPELVALQEALSDAGHVGPLLDDVRAVLEERGRAARELLAKDPAFATTPTRAAVRAAVAAQEPEAELEENAAAAESTSSTTSSMKTAAPTTSPAILPTAAATTMADASDPAGAPFVPTQYRAPTENATAEPKKTGKGKGYDADALRGMIFKVLKGGRIAEHQVKTYHALIDAAKDDRVELRRLFEQVRAEANQDAPVAAAPAAAGATDDLNF